MRNQLNLRRHLISQTSEILATFGNRRISHGLLDLQIDKEKQRVLEKSNQVIHHLLSPS
jgi:hypothetical protein